MYKFIIFGTGLFGRQALQFFGGQNGNVKFWSDNNSELHGKLIEGIEVIPPSELNKYADECILVIATKTEFFTQIKYQLNKEYGIEKMLNYTFLKSYMNETGITVDEFLKKCSEKDIYRLMFYYAEEQERYTQERIEFFVSTCDITRLKSARGKLRIFQLELLEAAYRLSEDLKKNKLEIMLEGGTLLGAVRHEGFIPWDDDIDFMMIRSEYDKMINYYEMHGWFYNSEVPYYDEKRLYYEMYRFLNRCDNDYALCSNGKFVKVFFKRIPEPIVLDIFPIDYYNDNISFEQLMDIDIHMKNEFDKKSDKSIIARDKWYKEKRSNGEIVRENGSHLCYGLETDFLKVCNGYISIEDVLPLTEISFENRVFLSPKDPSWMLKMEYGDYMQWPNDAGSTVHGVGRRFSRYKSYNNPYYIHTMCDAKKIWQRKNKLYDGCQVIVEKYKISDWKKNFDIIDYLDEHNVDYIVYA